MRRPEAIATPCRLVIICIIGKKLRPLHMAMISNVRKNAPRCLPQLSHGVHGAAYWMMHLARALWMVRSRFLVQSAISQTSNLHNWVSRSSIKAPVASSLQPAPLYCRHPAVLALSLKLKRTTWTPIVTNVSWSHGMEVVPSPNTSLIRPRRNSTCLVCHFFTCRNAMCPSEAYLD